MFEMIDFNEILKVATATATKATAKTTKTVPNQEVADKIMWIAERGYIPDEQTEHIVRAYLKGSGIFVSGPVGVGKTFLLKLLASSGVLQHADRDINEWGISGIKGWYDYTDGKEIIIDDLGCERVSKQYGDSEDLLKAVIEHRYAAQSGRTHITTNLNSTQIRDRYGDRILDRILAMCIPFKMVGSSYRRKHNADERARIAQVES